MKRGATLDAVVCVAMIVACVTYAVVKLPALEGAGAFSDADVRGDNEIIITSFNTEYWHESEAGLLAAIADFGGDIVLLQEHLQKTATGYTSLDRVAELGAEAKGFYIDAHGEVVTLSKWPIVKRKEFGAGTGLRSDVEFEDGSVMSVYNIHLPVHLHPELISTPSKFFRDAKFVADKRNALLKDLISDISNNKLPVVIGGDFNTSIAMNSNLWFRKNLVDAYAARQCSRQYGTWDLLPFVSWRIDYLYLSDSLRPSSYCSRKIADISDHRAISVRLQRQSQPMPQLVKEG